MVTQAEYLTGNKEGIEEFISRFDVSQETMSLPLNVFIRSLKVSLPFAHGTVRSSCLTAMVCAHPQFRNILTRPLAAWTSRILSDESKDIEG